MTEAFDSPDDAVPLHLASKQLGKHFPLRLIEQLERFERLEQVLKIRRYHDLAASAGSKFFAAKESSVRFGDRVVRIILHCEGFFVEQSIAFLAVPVKAVDLVLAPLSF
jgi:hypothetical protein